MKNALKIVASLLIAAVMITSPLVVLSRNLRAASFRTWVDPSGDIYNIYIESNTCTMNILSDNGDGVVTCPSTIEGTPVTDLQAHHNNSIKTIDLSNASNLLSLDCSFTNITSLDISGCCDLRALHCVGNRIESIDISHNSGILQTFKSSRGINRSEYWSGAGFGYANALLYYQQGVPNSYVEYTFEIDIETNVITDQNYMYRLYNPNSYEHFYTSSSVERMGLEILGWQYEGTAWIAPTSGDPVYRMYNPNAGDHHYTTSSQERDDLRNAGWNYEGIGWYSAPSNGTPLHRLYNPNATGAGAHHYTSSIEERDNLVGLGWRYEGIGWYGM